MNQQLARFMRSLAVTVTASVGCSIGYIPTAFFTIAGVMYSASRDVHVVSAYTHDSSCGTQLRARSFHARPVGKGPEASADSPDDLKHDEAEGISHTMLWLFVLRTGVLHSHQAHISAVDVDNFFAVVRDFFSMPWENTVPWG